MEFIKDFKNLSKHDTAIAGGKGASLGEMTQAGISVPGGFVILSNAFEKFLEETDLNVEIDSILHSVNLKEIHTIENASEKIKSLIIGKDIPEDIKKDIQTFFKKLNAKFVAVRSSATAEDSSSAAWAGQLESYLNTTEKNLFENVKNCWASLFTPRAIFYRFEQNLDNQKISVAVVVQKMVDSEISGVAFSVHPITQDNNQIIIEAGFGLGEAIVSGQITPDSYVVGKKPLSIFDVNINRQLHGIYRNKNGGNGWKEISKTKGESQTLSDNQILKLSKIILSIEKHYKFPCDIEWALEKNKFYITQSRPITTLKFDKKSNIGNVIQRVLKSKFIVQKAGVKVCTIYPVVEAATQELIKRFPFSYDPLVCLVINNNALYAMDEKSAFMVGRSVMSQGLKGEAIKKLYKIWEQDLRLFKKNCNKLLSINLRNISNKNLHSLYKNFYKSYLNEYSLPLITDGFGFWVEKIFPEIISKEIRNKKGLSHITGKLSQANKRSFLEQEKEDLLLIINQSETYAKESLSKAFSKYCEKYYWTRSSYLKNDDVNYDYFLKQVRELHNNKNTEAKRSDIFKKINKDKRKLIKNLKLSGQTKRLIKLIEMTTHWQDQRKMANMMANYWIHTLNKEVARRKKISFNAIENFSPYEIMDLIIGTKKDLNISRNRKIGIIGTNMGVINIPSEKIKEIEEIIEGINITDKNIIHGTVASRGIVRGKVKIIKTEKDLNKIKSGEILVCSMTRPELMPAVKKAKAIITDEGGLTCHAAIVSRELEIPCIIGTKIATKILKDGNLVEVDAERGLVKIIKK